LLILTETRYAQLIGHFWSSFFPLGLLDHVTVLIGVAVKGRAIAGIIHQPFYNYQVAIVELL